MKRTKDSLVRPSNFFIYPTVELPPFISLNITHAPFAKCVQHPFDRIKSTEAGPVFLLTDYRELILMTVLTACTAGYEKAPDHVVPLLKIHSKWL